MPILLGEVARQIRENSDTLFDLKVNEQIEWGITEKDLTSEKVSLFKTWGFKENEKGFEYTFENIPIQIVVIKGDYPFFKNLDTKFYKVDEYKIPNPFEEYWKNRTLIQ